MSIDFSLVVRSRKRSLDTVRNAVRSELARQGARLMSPHDPDEEDASAHGDVEVSAQGRPRQIDLHVCFADEAGGAFAIRWLPRGFELSLVDYASSDPSYERMADLLGDIGARLGTVLEAESDEAQALLEEADNEDDEESDCGPLSHVALIELLDREGQSLQQGQIHVQQFFDCIEPGGMLRAKSWRHPLLDEDQRFALKGARLIVTVHTGTSEPFRRYAYELDGYGRVRSFSVTSPDGRAGTATEPPAR